MNPKSLIAFLLVLAVSTVYAAPMPAPEPFDASALVGPLSQLLSQLLKVGAGIAGKFKENKDGEENKGAAIAESVLSTVGDLGGTIGQTIGSAFSSNSNNNDNNDN